MPVHQQNPAPRRAPTPNDDPGQKPTPAANIRRARNPLEAVARRAFLVTAWPWRSLAYVLTTPPAALAAALPLGLLSLPWLLLLRRAGAEDGRPSALAATSLVLLGITLVASLGPLVALPLAELERRRLRVVDARPAASAHQRPRGTGPAGWLRTRYTEPATWCELGYAFLLATVIPLAYGVVLTPVLLVGASLAATFVVTPGAPVSLGLGEVGTVGEAVPYALAAVALLPAVPYVLALLAGAHGALARTLLGGGPGGRLRAELVEVSRSRMRLVDAFEAERRRIERDLHDGAQQRLISLTLQLGLARLDLPPGSPAALAVTDAHGQAKQLMAELRELIHGIHPQILTDLGLPAALRELAEQQAIPVTVRADLPVRAPSHVEATAYFVAAEALTNIVKHSGATSASLSLRRTGTNTTAADGSPRHAGTLTMEIRDNGHGGADPRRGTGLTGLADRVAVTGGTLALSSPPGGPTLLRVEIPCTPDDLPSE
ncbi:sensor histidine kinase [Sphaerisporangium corydalis]|uniref:histidine kinase n=1 Tax=Sphaerisporangium corydalis TaxID=1441875 RepID=A0ABV9EK71_9ACTN|nr:sensor histidine kinase [Sphaerisporangium corydalis]